ncbi:MAG: hypothetical protein RRB12_08410 [Armatimonadota bacterium]|nr:hypothetical protein [Armatimonadota bacterium]
MANSDWRLGKRKLIVGVAISHDKNGGQVGSRQIGRSGKTAASGEWRVANSVGANGGSP